MLLRTHVCFKQCETQKSKLMTFLVNFYGERERLRNTIIVPKHPPLAITLINFPLLLNVDH